MLIFKIFTMTIKNTFTIMILAGLGFSSCKKFVDIDPPITKVETETIFENESSAMSAVAGLYSKMLSSNLNMISGGTTIYTGLSSDEILNTVPSAVPDAFRTNSLLPTTGSYALSFWTTPYNLIFHANSILEGLDNSTAISDSAKNQLRGEVLVSRALLYFYLVNLFGDVPYVTGTDYRVNGSLPRTGITQIYAALKNDMVRAQILLKENYPSGNRFRPNKFTATALLARLYLYTGEYSLAEAASDAIINSSRYSIVALSSVFTGTSSNETIWSLMRDNGNTNEGNAFVPPSATVRPVYQLTPQLLAAFEPGDQRKLVTATGWLGKNTVSGVDYYYPKKYKLTTPSGGVTPGEFLVVFRLAEQYLIRAEARLNTGNLTGALQDLNIIRARAGLPALSLLLDAAQVKLAILQERRIELFAEWGHRWLDLKRTAEATNVLGPLKGSSWQVTDMLYPIPQNEINLNPFLVQNPGY
jgi:hypothetical protein